MNAYSCLNGLYVSMYGCERIHVHIYEYKGNLFMCVCLHANGCINNTICLCACVCIYAYMCENVYVYACNIWMMLVCGCINACTYKYTCV